MTRAVVSPPCFCSVAMIFLCSCWLRRLKDHSSGVLGFNVPYTTMQKVPPGGYVIDLLAMESAESCRSSLACRVPRNLWPSSYSPEMRKTPRPSQRLRSVVGDMYASNYATWAQQATIMKQRCEARPNCMDRAWGCRARGAINDPTGSGSRGPASIYVTDGLRSVSRRISVPRSHSSRLGFSPVGSPMTFGTTWTWCRSCQKPAKTHWVFHRRTIAANC
jgi:hypothetical protein